MLFSDMKTALKRYGFDDTDPLATWLNAAKDDFQAAYDWPFTEGLAQLSVTAGTNTIAIPGDFFKAIYLRDVTNQHKLKFMRRRMFADYISDPTQTGYVDVYTLVRLNQVQLYPVPSLALTMDLLYQVLIPDMTVDANPPQLADGTALPTPCHYPIVQRAASIALQAENEEDRAQQAEREFQNSLIRLFGKFGEQELDEVETTEDAQGYGTDVYTRLRRR